MPNILDANGLQTNTRAELVAFFTAQFQTIYGADINLGSDTPDGQLMNIFIQSVLDVQDLLTQVYNMQDPDNAIGVILDQRAAINGVERQDGTYTITPITLVNSQSVNLYGIDAVSGNPPVRSDGNQIYTVADNAGNRWFLQATQSGLSPGTHVLSFRAENPGAVLTIPNTITVPVTIILGVDSINNPTSYTTLGTNEETDAALKVRRSKSVSLASQGYLNGLLAALENTSGVSSAFVYENLTNVTNGDGVPGHSIWVIVAGSAADSDIAEDIYTKRNAGAGMYGSTTYTITQVDGSPFVVRWDTVLAQNVFIQFTVTSINGTTLPNISAIRPGIVSQYIPGVNQEVNINALSTIVQDIDSNTLVTNAGFSLGQTQVATLSGVAAGGTFLVRYNGANSAAINWNDAIGVIQTKVQAVSGLSVALVTGSIASQTLTFDLSSVSPLVGLITVASNSLVTSAPAPITFSFNEGYVNILNPSSKRNQLVISEANIIILPMQLLPMANSVPTGNTIQFAAYGGYGTYTYSISVNNSGGSINATSGLYTAGPSTSVTDTVKVVDQFGNIATAAVQVVS